MIARIFKSGVSGRDERLLFPVAIVTCIVLVAILCSVFLLRDSVNEQEIEAEKVAVQRALDDARTGLGARTEALAESLPTDLLPERAGPKTLPTRAGAAFLVDLARDFSAPTGERAALFRRLAPVAAEFAQVENLRGQLADAGRSAHWGFPRTLAVVAGGEAWLVAFVPSARPAPAQRLAVLGVQRIDDRLLADVARAARTQRIDLGSHAGEPDMAALRIDYKSDGDLGLVWRAEQPGRDIVDHNAFLLVAFASVFAALIVFHSKRVTQEATAREARARAEAGQDPMTGLPNRVLFMKLLDGEIERVRRSLNDRGAAVLLLDLDRLREVNAASGEEAADRLLVALAGRLAGIVRSSGRIGRIGGDEFAILQTDIVGPRDAEILARRIVEALAEPLEIDGRRIYVSASIGIALCPDDADDAEELMRRADLALYRAKNAGRNTWRFFEPKIGEQLKLQKAVEDDLRAAIDGGGLQLLYQPVMDSAGKRIVGVEALVRWPHPTHGFISPQNFIALAEECGLILPLGEWVLRRALSDIRNWPGLRIAVNVSGLQLRDPGFVDMLQAMLKQLDVDAARLELEVTENILLSDADAAEDAMVKLRAMGVRLALDDFGTGYSSLIYLRRFSFDKIKIDKSFLDSIEATGDSAIIVHSIVHLGRALGLTVTAEGVETADQHRFLQALACHEMQGYLFSRPVEAAEITTRLEAQRIADARRAVA
jgi:diguanylate cyclase (GGDEF)-like protein